MNSLQPLVAVVVLSFGPRPTLAAAVRSLIDQDERAEIVVVHSGPGDAATVLTEAGLDVSVVVSPTPLLPGAARNIGVASTRAPIVAFLADDCEARPGWVRTRREAHEEGHLAVASSVLSHRPGRPVALAAHLSLYVNRMPLAKPEHALKFGASYTRTLFDSHGPFREDLRGGEDSDFNARLGGEDQIFWCPEVVTVHHGTEKFGRFIGDQAARGRRMVVTRHALDDGLAKTVATDALIRMRRTVYRSFGVVERRQLPIFALAAPIMLAGALAYAAGASTYRRSP